MTAIRQPRLAFLGDVAWPAGAAVIYGASHALPLKRFLDGGQVTQLVGAVSELPARRVCVLINPDMRWDSQDVPSGHAAFRAFASEGIVDAIRATLGLPVDSAAATTSWSHHYRSGEYVAEHRDAAGTVQLLICLRTSSVEYRDALFIARNGSRQQIQLDPGDALLFDATRLPHGTTPVISPDDDAEAGRLVLVTRYYFSEPARTDGNIEQPALAS